MEAAEPGVSRRKPLWKRWWGWARAALFTSPLWFADVFWGVLGFVRPLHVAISNHSSEAVVGGKYVAYGTHGIGCIAPGQTRTLHVWAPHNREDIRVEVRMASGRTFSGTSAVYIPSLEEDYWIVDQGCVRWPGWACPDRTGKSERIPAELRQLKMRR